MILKPDRKLCTPPRSIVMPRPWWRQRGFFTPFAMFPSRLVGGADFDGTNDYMLRGGALTGAPTASAVGILSMWVRIDSGDGTTRRIWNGNTTLTGSVVGSRFSLNTDNNFVFTGADPGENFTQVLSSAAYAASSTWRHVLVSWDISQEPDVHHMYVDGVDVTSSVLTAATGTYDHSVVPQWSFAIDNIATKTNMFSGCIAEAYVNLSEFLDFDTAANVLKFRTASGKPAYLGRDGSKPTGTAPIIYQRLRKNEAVANFATNRGTGGDFAITGALDYVAGPGG